MKLEYVGAGASGWSEILAVPTDYDGYPPVTRLRLHWPLGEANVDRTAVGASLVFSPWIAGTCDHGRPFSPLTQQRLLEWFQSRLSWTVPVPSRLGASRIPRGRERVHLDCGSNANHEKRLKFVDSAEGSGIESGLVRVASNIRSFMDSAPTEIDRFIIRLGGAVLVAESLHASEIVDKEFAARDPQEFSHAVRLLECVSLGLKRE